MTDKPLNDLTRKEEFDALMAELQAAGEAFNKARAKARYHEDAEKPILADIMRTRQDGGAVEMKKLLAYGDADYRAYLKEKHGAQYEADTCYLRLERARIRLDEHSGRWSLIKTQIDRGLA